MLTLPCELILEILHWLSAGDLCNLRLVCKRLAEILAPEVFRNLRIDLQPERAEKDVAKIEKLSQGYPLAAQSIRHLHIGWLNPRLHQGYQGSISANSKAIQICKVLDMHLFQCLQSLEGLKSISLYPVLDSSGWQSNWGPRLIQMALVNPGLEHLSFCITSTIAQHHFPEQLPSLRTLDVTFKLDSPDSVDNIISELRRLVDTSPSLTNFSLTRWVYGRRWNFPTKDGADILSHIDSTTLSIRELSICDVPFPIARSLHHFRNLNSLTLEYDKWNDWRARRRRSYDAVAGRPPLDNPSNHRAELWKNLRWGEIWLSTIVVDHACPDFLQYLESYSRLLHLTIGEGDYPTADASDEAAKRFYQESLPHHTSTLIFLRVHPEYAGGWSFSLDNWRTIKRCGKLMDLSLVIDLDKAYPDDSVTDLTTALDLSLRRLKLRRFSFKDRWPERFRNPARGRGPGHDLKANARRLHAEATSYHCSVIHGVQPPELTISGEYRYKGVVEKDMEGDYITRYVVVSQPLGPPVPSSNVESDSD